MRNYEEKDFDKLIELIKLCGIYHKDYHNERINEKSRRDPDSIIVLEEEGNIIGCVTIFYDPQSSYIYQLAVHPDFRKRGLGTKLLREAERRLKERGTNPVTIFVENWNKNALGFYKKLGYDEEETVYMSGKEL